METSKKKKAADKKGKVKKEKKPKAPKAAPSIAAPTAPPVSASVDFEAGIMFNKFDKKGDGLMTADEFRQFYREALDPARVPNPAAPQQLGVPPSSQPFGPSSLAAGRINDSSNVAFEAGKIFSQFDRDRDGKIDKREFEDFVRNRPDLFGVPSTPLDSRDLPLEVVSGKVLTHYDEELCVGLPSSSVEQHRAMGHTVVPLMEAFGSRYNRLRAQLTGRLYPRREYLLQLREKLRISSLEVEASRNAIERETKADAEQILARLRTMESHKQSTIQQEVLKLEEELRKIETVAQHVEGVSDMHLSSPVSGILLSSSSSPSKVRYASQEDFRGTKADRIVDLISKYGILSSKIDQLAQSAISVQSDFPTDDFPKETADRLRVLARCDHYVQSLSVKDHMLWSAMQERNSCLAQLDERTQLCGKYANEVAEWAEVAQGLAAQVDALKKEKDVLARRNKDMVAVMRDHNIRYEYES